MLKVRQEHIDRAFRIAHWYGRRTPRAEVSDLESAALEGLAKAVRDWEPEVSCPVGPGVGRKRSFWSFAFIRIVGEMRDELRRFDHLTRNQRAQVVEGEPGELLVDQEGLDWMNPQEPLSLDSSGTMEGVEESQALVESIQEPRDPIEAFELRDAVCRAGAPLSERTRFVFVKSELEGYSNSELADAFDVTQGRASQLRAAAFDQMREQIGDSFLDAA